MVDEIEMMNTYRARIIKPICAENPIGTLLIDDADLDFIEAQMMKVGSLNMADVQWTLAEDAAILLLETRSKDLKILTYLLQCLQYVATPKRVVLSLYVLSDFIEHYWDIAYPLTRENDPLHRLKFFTQIFQRTQKALERINVASISSVEKMALTDALIELGSNVQARSLPIDKMDALNVILRRKLLHLAEISCANEGEESQKNKDKEEIMHFARSETKIPADIFHDTKVISEASKRAFLLNVVTFLSSFSGAKEHAMRLRRLAIWFEIKSAPETDTKGETDFMPVCSGKVADYKKSLIGDVDESLWERIEYSLTVAPFWIDGHFLSHQAAMALGFEECAKAIIEETRRFIARVPGIVECRFRGGLPFVSEETQSWLAQDSEIQNKHAVTGTWMAKREQALTLAQTQGLHAGLSFLNNELQEEKEPREQFYQRLFCAEVMGNQSLFAIATQEYQALLSLAENMTLIDWEPSLVQRLKHLVDAD